MVTQLMPPFRPGDGAALAGSEHAWLAKAPLSIRCRLGTQNFTAPHILRLTRDQVTFQFFGPNPGLQSAQRLDFLELMAGDRAIYSEPATVESVADVESSCVVVARLRDGWMDAWAGASVLESDALPAAFRRFATTWKHQSCLVSAFRQATEEMTSFFQALRAWTDALELPLQSLSAEAWRQTSQSYAAELAPSVHTAIDRLFEGLEEAATSIPEDDRPKHWQYLRHRLHPLLLCSPFAWRTFSKPLGYPGDFEMVNMIARRQSVSGSLFAQLVDLWFLRQRPAEAHRKRLELLVDRLRDETLNALRHQRRASVLNLGCGPAVEIERFLAEHGVSSHADFVLADFNQETLDAARQNLENCAARHGRRSRFEFRRVSVLQFLRSKPQTVSAPFSFVYCAGLFDYLGSEACRQLLEALYASLMPGGLLLVTNVDPTNPIKHGMSSLLDWQLTYRTAEDLLRLVPSPIPPEQVRVCAEPEGLNLFLEIRKPEPDPESAN